MRRSVYALLMSAGIALFTGCSPQEVLPTLISSGTNEVISTMTAPAEVTIAVPVSPTAARTRPTLPPTFTPTTPPTDEPTATEVFVTASPFVSAATADANCNTFATVFDQTTLQFVPGESPVVSWQPVVGAELYRVILSEVNGRIINDGIYVKETTYTFPASLFVSGVVYGWEVYPINARNDQMCFAVGQPLIPSTPLPLPGSGG